MRFTRRHARALVAGAATTAAYLAGAKLSDSRTVRGAGLLALMMAGVVSAQDTASMTKKNKKRLDDHIAATADAVHFMNHGGTVGGPITTNSQISANGGIQTGGAAIGTSGGSVTTGPITTSGQISMGGSLVMNNHDAFTFGHVTANQIGPGGDRANLGSFGTNNLANLNAVAARCDFLLGQLENAGICY